MRMLLVGLIVLGSVASSVAAVPAGVAATGECAAAVAPAGATASTEEAGNPAEGAIDGDPGTRWSGQGFGAHLTLDLGAVRELCAATVSWYRGDVRWNDFTIYVSDEASFGSYTKVWEGRSEGATRRYDFTAPAMGRYLRISFWQNPENDWASITEAAAHAVGTTQPGDSHTVVAVGDIANFCDDPAAADCPAMRTADLALSLDPAKVLTLGDQANGDDFGQYVPNWGRLKDRTLPTPGNHEYEIPGAPAYFDYFGDAARPDGTSWYSTDLGGWHIVSLNSEVDRNEDGEQAAWLRQDLAATTQPCVLATWHRPKYSSGSGHGDFPNMRPFWAALHDAGADVVLNGHDHDYERFAPQDPDGAAAADGIRQFVVGTGGSTLRPFAETRPNSEVRVAQQYGVLELTLAATSYSWRFPRRRPALSFQHHAEVAALPDAEQDTWLSKAEQGGWSRNQLRQHLRSARRGTTDDATTALPKLVVQNERIARWRLAADRSSSQFEQWVVAALDQAAARALDA